MVKIAPRHLIWVIYAYPEEPVGGSAAVPNLFARPYLRAHDPGPPAYLSFLSPANEAIPHNLENGFPALPFPLSALQSHHYKAAEAGPPKRLRAWTPRPTERALTVNLCCSMSFTRTVRNARIEECRKHCQPEQKGMLPPKPCDGLVAVRDVNVVRPTIEVSRKVYLTAAIAPFHDSAFNRDRENHRRSGSGRISISRPTRHPSCTIELPQFRRKL